MLTLPEVLGDSLAHRFNQGTYGTLALLLKVMNNAEEESGGMLSLYFTIIVHKTVIIT